MTPDPLKAYNTWAWTKDSEQEKTIQKPKDSFCSAPILMHFDPDLQIVLKYDALDKVCSRILSQKFPVGDKLVLRPISYISKKIWPAVKNG